MRQNGHGAVTLEDVRTWIEETGLCIFLPRSAQAGFTAPTFVEAVAGQRTNEPTLELVATAEQLLVRLEADGVAVRLNLAGQPGDQPDYVVAGWVLPYVYALRGDRDWRRSPQLTGSRQVSQLAVLAAKQIDSANMTAGQIRDALGREVTETAVLRALHELWKQLRIIPVVPEATHPALWQPLRQRFQKAIAEGASTSQVTAISVLASIYLQAVIAASMEEIEQFLSPLTSRSKIREVVRGLAATRQVHSTTMGHSPMYYVAGTLPEFPAVPSYSLQDSYPSYQNSFKGRYSARPTDDLDEELPESIEDAVSDLSDLAELVDLAAAETMADASAIESTAAPLRRKQAPRPIAARPAATRPAAARPRTARGGSAAGDRRRPAANRGASGHSQSSPASRGSNGNVRSANANGHSEHKSNGSNGANGSNGTSGSNGSHTSNGSKSANRPNGSSKTNGSSGSNGSHYAKPAANGAKSGAGKTSAAKRFSFSGQAKQTAKPASRTGSKPAARQGSGPAAKPRSGAPRASDAKRRG
jgi:hypothetical protein